MVTVSVLLLLLSVFSPPVHNNLTTFHVIPVLMNQTDARAACRGNYTDLVTVYSDEDNTELDNLMMKAGGGSWRWAGGWIGLYRGQFSEKWSNGDPVTFSNLTGDCGTSSCCAAMKPDGSWESLQCTGTRYFMCYGQGDIKAKPNYHLILENKTWYEAQRYCRGRYTDLVSIRDQQQNEEVKIKGLNSSTSFWIGLLRDDWQWTDGGNSAYRNWGSYQPQPSPYDCVYLMGGTWYSAPCSNTQYPLCYNSSIHVSAEALSWQEALGYCNEGNRAGILNIDSEAEQEEVESELRRRRVSETLWVGLRQSRLFGFWFWTDGTIVSPDANWDEGKPPEGPLSQHCGAIVPPDYRWRDMNCGARYRALCHTCSP
ncbi:secretory phospholipase A2 receptor-like [Clarias gariepinus]|uniref:secretory phospholipase A2 receptor-like n=1 Tax=Clarias gariepinus TaxID=13013 RepID=UPI00234D92C3|nr:secretory phospholipase A2 receptor-like [Clarias gariepinus]